MNSELTKEILGLLKKSSRVSDYKINVDKKESYELFYVKGKLETVRATDTCDREVTVYVDHDGFRGDASFYVYPSTTGRELEEKLQEAISAAEMIRNAPYTLPQAEEGEYTLKSNLSREPMAQLADQIAKLSFSANTQEGGSINSLEIFLNKHQESVCNSRGLRKTQHYYSAMVEAIPTFNGSKESVELYEQYNFTSLDPDALVSEIAQKMADVKARYEAVKPDFSLDCPVILHKQELNELFTCFADDLNYASVYAHGNCFHKGDSLQENRTGDALTLTMKGSLTGNIGSSSFDGDGLSLGEATLIRDGIVESYYGSNRFGQYLKEAPTGSLGCLTVAPGTWDGKENGPWLEVLSMSGLQVDLFNDYIGGEIRLASYHDGEKSLPITGISFSGSLKQVLASMRLSQETATFDCYTGPAAAALVNVKIF